MLESALYSSSMTVIRKGRLSTQGESEGGQGIGYRVEKESVLFSSPMTGITERRLSPRERGRARDQGSARGGICLLGGFPRGTPSLGFPLETSALGNLGCFRNGKSPASLPPGLRSDRKSSWEGEGGALHGHTAGQKCGQERCP